LNNESFTVKRGDVLFVTPLDSHAYKATEDTVSTVTVHFELSTAIPYTTLDAGVVRENAALYECFSLLFKEYNENGAYKKEALKNLLERILILYIRAQSLTAHPLPSDITYAVGYVHKHYFEELSLAKISELCGYSQGYFCRKFKQYTHYHFVAYLNHVRLLNAARLLCGDEALPILRIAEDCGFSGIRQFNREFLKKFGCSPSAYRKRSK
jgi:AraC-like DNA-binding protein